jgi:hypothetical protein
MALMAAHGEIGPMPDCAIFADTGWEPAAVYEHLTKLSEALPFPVYRVSAGDIRADTISKSTSGRRVASAPWYVRSPRGKLGMGMRQCTKEYKLRPIQRKVVELLGARPKGGCEMWIGISRDEIVRMKPSRVGYIVNRWPLVEREMHRRHCIAWLAERGWAAPRSACIGCPYRSDEEWRALTPEEFGDAIEVDEAIRRQPGIRGEQFVHRSFRPLAEVDLSTAEERGQGNLFNNECEGMCGV